MLNVTLSIPINDYRVLAYAVIFTVLFLGLAAALGFWIYTILTAKTKKEKKALKSLKERAKTDENAKKRLDKTKRRAKRRFERNRAEVITEQAIICFSVIFALVVLFMCIVPSYTDFIKKDYVTYVGEIKVYEQMKRSRIELDDGTTVWGKGVFNGDDTYGTVVYSKRTKLFVGGER